METQHRLLILAIVTLLSISLVSAPTMSSVSTVDLNANFNLVIAGSSFYALELIIPQEFQIIEDSSGGVRTNNLYKTVTTGSLILQLRGTQLGTYTISGQYTDGNGIKDLNQISIQIIQPSTPISLSCPICPDETAWSNCVNNKQIKYAYSCSSQTNYQCTQSTQTQTCQTSKCEARWICTDSYNIAYQSSDCSLSSIQHCEIGCINGECIPTQNVSDDNLTIDINPEKQGILQSFFSKIADFIKNIIDILIFWN